MDILIYARSYIWMYTYTRRHVTLYPFIGVTKHQLSTPPKERKTKPYESYIPSTCVEENFIGGKTRIKV
ncbi:hypothetical protein PV327_007682 [Microctonus hyperodae]|uniref:Uncharacterized protein n=1 Tax=Microctonus hyperodae TaxID=165561 RepID=A0AA39G104_MICHY|nr:hypothetical protein PV327_007682 [Microctonus hyperodae]